MTTCLQSEIGSGRTNPMNVLSLNPGSSSLKFALFSVERDKEAKLLVRGLFDQIGTDDCLLKIEGATTGKNEEPIGVASLTKAVELAIDKCLEVGTIDATGCRVVHGGNTFHGATVTSPSVIGQIKLLSPLAPLHNSRDVETIEAAQTKLAEKPVIAVFDTTFHRTLPPEAYTYAIPNDLQTDLELRRYGFHGISYRFVSNRLTKACGKQLSRVIVCHLGSGASMCAIKDGKSIDTSMGFTPLEGLVMGTRSGDIDPGLLIYLQRERGYGYAELDTILNHKSGLAGISEAGGDVRQLEEAISHGNRDAELAIDVFCYRVCKYVGAYFVALGGLDALVFCGGIGENATSIRERIGRRLALLGISIESDLNSKTSDSDCTQISGENGPSVWVVKTNEEHQIALEVIEVLN